MKRTIVVISVAPVFHVMASAAVAMAAALSVSAQVKDLGSVREVMWDMDRIAVLGGGERPNEYRRLPRPCEHAVGCFRTAKLLRRAKAPTYTIFFWSA